MKTLTRFLSAKLFIVATLFVAAPAVVLLTGCGDSQEAEACATCTKGKKGENVWCEACGVGYVDGNKTGCESCYKGKTGESVWCEACSAGYIKGDKTACKDCYEHKANGGPACKTCAMKKDGAYK